MSEGTKRDCRVEHKHRRQRPRERTCGGDREEGGGPACTVEGNSREEDLALQAREPYPLGLPVNGERQGARISIQGDLNGVIRVELQAKSHRMDARDGCSHKKTWTGRVFLKECAAVVGRQQRRRLVTPSAMITPTKHYEVKSSAMWMAGGEGRQKRHNSDRAKVNCGAV